MFKEKNTQKCKFIGFPTYTGASIIILASKSSKHHSLGELIAEQIKHFPFKEVVFVLGLNS